jgi:uncharacterized beta-barrel protein YwiB (DUF1934 family)
MALEVIVHDNVTGETSDVQTIPTDGYLVITDGNAYVSFHASHANGTEQFVIKVDKEEAPR